MSEYSEHYRRMRKAGYKMIVKDGKTVWVKEEPRQYKPSRLIDVDTDLAIMNMSEVLNSVKDTVEHIETMLWDIQHLLYRKDKKKQDSLRMKQLKRKAKKR